MSAVSLAEKAGMPWFDHSAYRPEPLVHYTHDPEDVAKQIAMLKSDDDVYGFDLEWKPNFIPGKDNNRVALMQIACRDYIFLFHIIHMPRIPDALVDFLADGRKRKVGVCIGGDAKKLFRDYGLIVNGVEELSKYARAADPKIKSCSLQNLMAHFACWLLWERLKQHSPTSARPSRQRRQTEGALQVPSPQPKAPPPCSIPQLRSDSQSSDSSQEGWPTHPHTPARFTGLVQRADQHGSNNPGHSIVSSYFVGPSPAPATEPASSPTPQTQAASDTPTRRSIKLAPRHHLIHKLWHESGCDLQETWRRYSENSSAKLPTVLSYLLEGAIVGLAYERESLYKAVCGHEQYYRDRFGDSGLLDL
ncbi:hypothetical protein RI367_006899 [Sorochytrium milnesiophthora]